ncbi:MAG: N-acetyltransferase [Cyanobacteria bacterium]|nr:N-acetyltransferase [Cyanobacteriota bacterium]
MIREQNELGASISVGSGSIIEHHTKIGDRVRIHSGVFIPEFTVIEADAWLGPKVTLTNARYPKAPDAKEQLKGPLIKTYAKLGANTTVLPGVTIGAHALVGAGSVVTKDVPDYAVVVGNPGRVINDVRQLAYAEQIQTLNQ